MSVLLLTGRLKSSGLEAAKPGFDSDSRAKECPLLCITSVGQAKEGTSSELFGAPHQCQPGVVYGPGPGYSSLSLMHQGLAVRGY